MRELLLRSGLLAAAAALCAPLHAAPARPIAFEVNEGQTDRRVRFVGRYGEALVFLTPQEMVLKFTEWEPEPRPKDPEQRHDAKATRGRVAKGRPVNVRMRFRGASGKAQVVGLEPTPGKSHYFVGNDPGKWRRNVSQYARVAYKELYPGIDLVFYSREGKLEYDFIVAPGADPSVIDLELAGMQKAALGPEGDLVLSTGRGEVRHRKPASFQDQAEGPAAVATEFDLRGPSRVGFKVKDRDPRRPLRIDPEILYLWKYDDLPASYWCDPWHNPPLNSCDPGKTWPNAVAVDPQRSAYIVGFTLAANFPTTPGVVQEEHTVTRSPGADIFVTKLSPDGSAPVYSTFLGGTGSDIGYDIAVDPAGQAHLTGYTTSSDFPLATQFQMAGGQTDAFAVKLSADGSRLVYSTYLGGAQDDWGNAIALDAFGNAYVVGESASGSFKSDSQPRPTGTGCLVLPDNPPCTDGFVAKLNAAGTALKYGFITGTPDRGWANDVVLAGASAYVHGYTDALDFPRTEGAYGTTGPGRYVAKLGAIDIPADATGNTYLGRAPLAYAAVVGGAGPMAVAADGSVYLAQWTGSLYALGKLDPQGATLTPLATFGRATDFATAMVVDRDGNVFLAGFRVLSDGSILFGGTFDSDGWLVKFNPEGRLLGQKWFGGTEVGAVYGSTDTIEGLAVDDEGNVYVTGLGYSAADTYGIYVAKVIGDAFQWTDPSMRGTCDNCETDNLGLPVNIYTGNVWLDQADAVVPGRGAPIELRRSYNSLTALEGKPGPFGLGWTHPYMQSLRVEASGRLRLVQANGVPMIFGTRDILGRIKADTPATETSWIEQGGSGYVRRFRQGGQETYDSQGRLTRVTDAVGNETSLGYDATGRLASVVDVQSGRRLDLAYNTEGLISSATGPESLPIASYAYDSQRRLTSVSYPDQRGFNFEYDSLGQLTAVKDAGFQVLESHTYEDFRGVSSEISGGREKLSFNYSPSSTTVTTALGDVTSYEWVEVRGSKLLLRRSGPCAGCSGDSEEYTYYPDGRKKTYKDAEGKVTSFTYNDNGDLWEVTDPGQRKTTYTYTYELGTGRILTMAVSSPGRGTTTTSYGLSGPESVVQDVTAQETRPSTFQYQAGKLWMAINPRGKTTIYTYYPSGDLQQVTDPNQNSTTFTSYDAMGRRRIVEDALQNQTETRYDEVGRVQRLIYPDLTYTDYGYDGAGRRTSVTDVYNRITEYRYDPYGRLEVVLDPRKRPTRYGYDIMSRQTSITDAEDRMTEFKYDGFGRLIKTTYPGGAFEIFTYDALGRLATRLDRRGITTTYSYDALGRLERKSYSNGDPDVVYGYDPDTDRMTSASNGADTLSWSYDLAGQVRTEASSKNQSTLGYDYYKTGSRKELLLNSETYLTYAYDDGERLTGVQRGAKLFGFGYDTLSRRTSRQNPNATAVGYDYEQKRSWLLAARNGAAGTIGYEYDKVGNRTSRSESGRSAEGYFYDPLLDRLKTVTRGGTLAEAYDYDKVGNRTSAQKGGSLLAGSYDERNRLGSLVGGGTLLLRGSLDESGTAKVNGQPARMLSDRTYEADVVTTPGTNTITVAARDVRGNLRTNTYTVDFGGTAASYSYDPNGNLSQKTENGSTWSYGWDAENRLVRVCKDVDPDPCTNANALARFAYDPLGRRVEKVAAGVTYSYLYDGQDILRETITSGASTTVYKYIHGPGIDEPLAREDAAGNLAYYYADGLGSIVKMTDAAGTVIQTRQYDAFGNLEVGASEPGYSFTGREWDPETRLYYYRARYYDPKQGRFISEDPIGFAAGVNFYSYVDGNPTNLVDPSGLVIETPWDAANVAMGLTSLTVNLASGNFVGAAVDAVGVAIDIAATATPGVPAGAGTAIQAYRGSKLARSMARVSRPVAKGVEAAHHMVAQGARKAALTRRHLGRCGIDVNDAVNGARLPRGFHQGLHTDAYYQYVEAAAAQWKNESEARQWLTWFRDQLEHGVRPWE